MSAISPMTAPTMARGPRRTIPEIILKVWQQRTQRTSRNSQAAKPISVSWLLRWTDFELSALTAVSAACDSLLDDSVHL